MSKQIALTQYTKDGAEVHVIVDTGERTTDADENEIPVTETFSFGAKPAFTDASFKTPFTVEKYVAQCEAEVQAIIDADAAKPEMVEVKR